LRTKYHPVEHMLFSLKISKGQQL